MKTLKVCHFTAKDENLGHAELRGQKMSAKSSLDLEPKNKEERKDKVIGMKRMVDARR